MPTFATGRSTFLLNLSTNLALLVVSVGMGIWFVPYLLENLGRERYGFIPLTANVSMFFGIFTLPFSIIATRDLTVELDNDNVQSLRIYNTSLVANVGVGILLGLTFMVLAFLGKAVFQIPDALSSEVRWLFAMVGLGFFSPLLALHFNRSARLAIGLICIIGFRSLPGLLELR